jgi:dTDP-4-amino-4,6-dideoxygalactose transaminase
MEHERIWLSPPHIDQAEHETVEQALLSNWLAPMGPALDQFEKKLALKSDTKFVAALNSGTSALHIGLKLLNVSAGDYVIVPTNTFVAPLHSIKYLNAYPILVDVDPKTWNIDLNCLEESLSHFKRKGVLHKIKAIIPVHLYGMPCDMKELLEISKVYNIPILEDAAEALGSSYHGRPLGGIGDYGVFSFNGNKIITTSGGGAICSNNEDGIKRAKMLSNQARSENDFYHHLELGYNYRMSNILASIGNSQISKLELRVKQRRENFENYRNYFQDKETLGYKIKLQIEPQGYFSNRWLTCISVNPKENRGIKVSSIKETLKQYNIESRPLNKPMHQQPLFKEAEFFSSGTSDFLYETGLSLPSGSNLKSSDFERIFKVLDQFFK